MVFQKKFSVRLGLHLWRREERGEPLVLSPFLREITGREVELARNPVEPDLHIVSQLDLHRAHTKLIEAGQEPTLQQAFEQLTGGVRALVVSFENFEHPRWIDFGRRLLSSKIPRTSFLPTSIDRRGVRFPYWWNYLDWPAYPRRKNSYKRYGRLYSLERLMEPVPSRGASRRLNRACFVGSYQPDGPRAAILEDVRGKFGLDMYGNAGLNVPSGGKRRVLKRYRFSVGAENSVGYGYDTEKLPEVWDSGCLPVGTLFQSGSDFNPAALSNTEPTVSHHNPLLTRPPDPRPLLDYLDNLIRR